MSIGVGIIGAGGIAELHGKAFPAAGAKLVAFCDVDITRAEKRAAAHPGTRAVGSVDELLGIDAVDAVVVAVPNHQHAPCAIRAIEAGRDVLLEKPMALNVAECDAVLAAEGATDRLLQVGFVTRCAPAARVAADILASGRLGRIYHAKACMYRRRGIPGLGGWFTDKSRSGGGALIDIGAHLVDAVLHFTGRPAPRSVSGVCAGAIGSPIGGYVFEEMWGGPPDPGGVFDVEDQAAGLIRFADGMTAEVNVTWAVHLREGHFPDGVVLMGERAGMHINAWSDNVRVFDANGDEDIPVTTEDAWAEAFQEQARRFVHSVETRTPPDASGRHGRDVQAILDAWYRSADEGRDVEC